jgi:hypothetical protein
MKTLPISPNSVSSQTGSPDFFDPTSPAESGYTILIAMPIEKIRKAPVHKSKNMERIQEATSNHLGQLREYGIMPALF